MTKSYQSSLPTGEGPPTLRHTGRVQRTQWAPRHPAAATQCRPLSETAQARPRWCPKGRPLLRLVPKKSMYDDLHFDCVLRCAIRDTRRSPMRAARRMARRTSITYHQLFVGFEHGVRDASVVVNERHHRIQTWWLPAGTRPEQNLIPVVQNICRQRAG